MAYEFDFSVVWDNYGLLLDGALMTLRLSALSMIAATIIALLTLQARSSRVALLRWIAIGYIEIIRNTPFLLQLYFFFFGLPSLGVRMSPNTAALVALALNGGAYAAEIMRGGVASIAKGQWEAGFALGLRPLQIFRYVILTPAMRAIYPALTSQFILLLLTSSIASAISASELTAVAQRLDSVTFRSFEIYFAATALYLIMSSVFTRIFNVLDRILFSYPTR
ncbi:amino acid ABC transporter permease [Acuticoccus kandeliae]|uniref:amino acid ABC transporter permease n=1 Tax=Acuticoccus kandeliae TaxID=2073160 RepID=UPI000D3E175D|nr:amino acid ABC transporter permease [Acuticoccus kandeliae]